MTINDVLPFIPVGAVVLAGVRFAWKSAMADHVHATQQNTKATNSLADAFTAEKESREEAHKETRANFHQIRNTLSDHETRLTVVEVRQDEKPYDRRRTS